MTINRKAQSQGALPTISALYRRVRQGQRRERNLAELAHLDASRLDDIGLSLADQLRILQAR